MYKKTFTLIILYILFLPITAFAQTDGIPLQKDVFLEYPITTTEDLPDQITFNLYDSQTALTPIATQTFPKGKYTVDFEFSKSDGFTSGNVARIKANFINKLNINDDPDTSTQIKEIWVGIEVAGTEVGERSQVSDETLVQLLLASDASIATYLTLAYEGDENPITTIYKDLPLSSMSSDFSGSSLKSYFSSLLGGSSGTAGTIRAAAEWTLNGTAVYYNAGNVGIGTTSPGAKLVVEDSQAGLAGMLYVGDTTLTNPLFQLTADTGRLRF